MALSAKQRQKKTEKKNAKRKRVRKSFTNTLHLIASAAHFANSPVHECLIARNLFEIGIGTVVIAKRAEDGMIAVSSFVLDVFCLGVKNAFFTLVTEHEYEQKIKHGLDQSEDGNYFEAAHATCAKKLIEGAVTYAQGFGFKPHTDYRVAIRILDNMNSASCPVKYHYGQDGKPFYFQGPNETPSQARKIVERLSAKCGDGEYDYIVEAERKTFDQDEIFPV